MKDTEPIQTVRTDVRRAARVAPAIGSVTRFAWPILALCALLLCAYLHGEVVALRGELGVARAEAHAARRDAAQATLDAQSARTALANAEPMDQAPASDDPNGDAVR